MHYLTNILFQSSVAVPGSFGVSGVGSGVTMVAHISGYSPGLARAQVSHGVRQVSESVVSSSIFILYVFRLFSAKTRITRLGSR